MRQSQLFTKTRKEAPADEIARNAQLLIRAGFIHKEMAGVYSFLPLGLRTLKKIENIIREEMNAIDGQEVLLSALHPKENWETTGRWTELDVLFKLKDGLDREYALGATHEEIVTPLAQEYVSSYRDLPFAVYQFQDKFRAEVRSKSGIMRGREFIMKDLYSFHATQEDLDEYYERAIKAYQNIFERCGLGEKTYLTYAGGGTFSKYSHEFQTLTDAGEDTVHLCSKCKVAVNEEILEEQPTCPKCDGALSPDNASETGNIFKLGTKYSTAFDLSFKDESGEEKPVLMGCYGIGLGRILGTVVEVLSDDNGMQWPKEVSPFDVHVIDLGQTAESKQIYESLQGNGVEVLFDDRDLRPGEKFADADLIGLPIRVVVSKKSLDSGGVEVKRRNGTESQIMSPQALVEYIKEKK